VARLAVSMGNMGLTDHRLQCALFLVLSTLVAYQLDCFFFLIQKVSRIHLQPSGMIEHNESC
jgi:hypothetical protein